MGPVEANKRVKPIARTGADLDLARMTKDAGVKTADEAVDYYELRFLSVKLHADRKAAIRDFARNALGSETIDFGQSGVEEALREVIHLVLSAPEYQLA